MTSKFTLSQCHPRVLSLSAPICPPAVSAHVCPPPYPPPRPCSRHTSCVYVRVCVCACVHELSRKCDCARVHVRATHCNTHRPPYTRPCPYQTLATKAINAATQRLCWWMEEEGEWRGYGLWRGQGLSEIESVAKCHTA